MSNQKISAMTAASALTGAELLWAIQGGADRKATVQQILDAVSGLGAAQSNRVTATVDRSQTTALAIESQLSVTLSPGSYLVLCGVSANYGSGGFKAALGAGTATLSENPYVGSTYKETAGAAEVSFVDSIADGSIVLTGTSGDDVYCIGFAFVQVSVAGTVGIKWAQRASHTDVTQLQSGWIAALGFLS